MKKWKEKICWFSRDRRNEKIKEGKEKYRDVWYIKTKEIKKKKTQKKVKDRYEKREEWENEKKNHRFV